MLHVLPPTQFPYEEADRQPGLPHPREVLSLIGHQPAEVEFQAGLAARRLHHAWLITGEPGIGKATLAYRMARYVLASGNETVGTGGGLDVLEDSRVAQQIAAAAHPDLAVIRRSYNPQTKSVSTEIRADDVRKALEVFEKTAAFGGYRVCIVDCCDELNTTAANALLKTLEEPPAHSLFLLVAHAPGRILTTIRSRCRKLALKPLDNAQVATVLAGLPGTMEKDDALRDMAAARSRGSVRRAASILDPKMLAAIERLEAVLAAFPVIDPAQIDLIADIPAGRAGEALYRAVWDTCEGWVEKQLGREYDERVLAIAEAWTRIDDKRRGVDSLNLDRRAFVVDVLLTLNEATRAG